MSGLFWFLLGAIIGVVVNSGNAAYWKRKYHRATAEGGE